MWNLPDLHAGIAMALAVAMFYLFSRDRARVEIIALGTMCFIALFLFLWPLPDHSANDSLVVAFGGFGHPALISICSLMILGRGLVVTGALDPVTRVLAQLWRWNIHAGLLVTLLAAFGLSMIVNDTPVLILMIPILLQIAANGGMAASKTLIPVNAAILIGGMATTIGTSTNLLVVSIASDLGMPNIAVFQFTPIVATAALIALPYIWLVMPRLLPNRVAEPGHSLREFDASLRVGTGAAIIGQTVAALRKKLPAGAHLNGPDDLVIEPGTRLHLIAPADTLTETAELLGAHAAPQWLITRLKDEARRQKSHLVISEMIISTDSRLAGHTLANSGLEEVAVLGVHCAPSLLDGTSSRCADDVLREGDVLLVMGSEENLQRFAQNYGLLQLVGIKELPRSSKTVLAISIVTLAIALASTGLVPIAISALFGATLMFVTGCIQFDRVGTALSGQVIVLVAASLAIGRFVLETGAAAYMGQLLSMGLQYLPDAGVLAAIMLFVTILTNFASNATAAAVGTPIAFSIATELSLPPEPLVLAVLFGCNLCYATPIAYQTNMLIMADGEYKFRDYVRTGVPLVLLMVATLSYLLVRHYQL